MLLSGTWPTTRVQQHLLSCRPAYPGEDACDASPPGQPGVEPDTARCGPAIQEVIAVAGAAGRPPEAAGQESQDQPSVSGDDGQGLPAARVAAGGATADPVKDY